MLGKSMRRSTATLNFTFDNKFICIHSFPACCNELSAVWQGHPVLGILRLLHSSLEVPPQHALELEIRLTMKDTPLEGDDAQLAAMGHRPELQRSFSTW
jgi:hypothetical protein